ncbi:MAG: hypothetical protein JWP52_182 [Rhizobacter sp.]|nr:hypothetical protein [Rhizobacter sp.]
MLRLWWLHALVMMLAGFTFYMVHNSLQTQATELAPSARGSAVALFAGGFFAGQGLGPLLVAPLLHAVGYQVTLVILAVGLLLLGQVIIRKVVPAGG